MSVGEAAHHGDLWLRQLHPGGHAGGVLDENLKRVPVVEKIDVKRYAQLLMEYDRAVSY